MCFYEQKKDAVISLTGLDLVAIISLNRGDLCSKPRFDPSAWINGMAAMYLQSDGDPNRTIIKERWLAAAMLLWSIYGKEKTNAMA